MIAHSSLEQSWYLRGGAYRMRIIQKPSTRSFRLSVGLYIVFNSLFLALVLLKPGTSQQFKIADDVGQALGWLLGTLLCFVGFEIPWRQRYSRAERAQRWVSLLLALGIFAQLVGQLIYTYYDLHNWTDFPSLADVGYLSTFPFFLIGILLIPTRPLSGITRTLVTLDGFITMVAAVTFSWYFILGPTMLQGNETAFAQIVGSAYPFFDLVLIFCVLRLWFRDSSSDLWPTITLLSLGLLVIVITDSIYDYQTLQSIYVNGWQDAGWPLGYMLIGLAAQKFNMARARQKEVVEEAANEEYPRDATLAFSSGWRALLPYALIPLVLLLTLYVWRTSVNTALEYGTFLGAAILVILLWIRQILTVREGIFYNRQLRRTQQELQNKNQALHQANTQLEIQKTQVAEAYEQQRYLNELKDQFLLNVNHELRTPLTAIHGYLELIQQYGETDPKLQATFISHAIQGCEELQELIGNVLDVIRGDAQGNAPRKEIFPVAPVVREVLDLFEPQKRDRYRIAVEIPETLAVKADRQYVHRILLNLLSNAFKYTPEQTPLLVSAYCSDHSSSHASPLKQ